MEEETGVISKIFAVLYIAIIGYSAIFAYTLLSEQFNEAATPEEALGKIIADLFIIAFWIGLQIISIPFLLFSKIGKQPKFLSLLALVFIIINFAVPGVLLFYLFTSTFELEALGGVVLISTPLLIALFSIIKGLKN